MPPLLVLLILGALNVLSDGRQLTTLPSDITSINSLGEKTPLTLDPKLRRALIRVLSKLEEEDSTSDGAELSDQEFFNIFGERAKSEDLGSIESSAEVKEGTAPNFQNQDFNYIPPTDQGTQPEGQYNNEYQQTDQQTYNQGYQPTYQQEYYQQPYQTEQQPYQSEQQPYQAEQGPYQTDEQGQQPAYGSHNEFPATNPTPGQAPNPVEAPQTEASSNQENVVNEEVSTVSEVTTVLPTTVTEFSPVEETNPTAETTTTAKEVKVNSTKHSVEFLQAPLIAAFTVQQDNQGVPRRVIPLQYQFQPVKNPEDNELVQKEAKLKQELQLLEQKKKEQRIAQQSQFIGSFIQQTEETRRQQELLLERQRAEEQRQYELHKLQQIERLRLQEQERKREEERLRYEELERQRRYRIQQDRYNGLDFQRSVDLPFNPFGFVPIQTQFVPGVELNRINRQESSAFIGNPGLNQAPDRQLQNLLLQSGVPPREDLGIVTKVLALNHGGQVQQQPPRFARFTRVPSRLIQPPLF